MNYSTEFLSVCESKNEDQKNFVISRNIDNDNNNNNNNNNDNKIDSFCQQVNNEYYLKSYFDLLIACDGSSSPLRYSFLFLTYLIINF